MLKKIGIFILHICCISNLAAQHPARQKIDSLKKLLTLTQGTQYIDCLNDLSEEYWWPPRVYPDSISMWADIAYKKAANNNYTSGLAKAGMHLGVSAIYRKHFLTAENYLRTALPVFDSVHDENGEGWCNLWLGQTLYSENRFIEAASCIRKSLRYLTRQNNKEGIGKAWAWLSFLYAATGNYDSSFEYCTKSLLLRETMSDHVCVAASLANMGYLYRSAGDYEDALSYYRQGQQYGTLHGINYYAANWNYFEEPIGATYQLMHNLDSSLYYLQRAMQIDPANQMTKISFGEALLLKHQYDSALAIFLKPLGNYRQENDAWDLMRILLDAAKAFEQTNQPAKALPYAQEGFLIAQKANVKPYMVQLSLLLAKIYKDLNKADSAYDFMRQYVAVNDSVKNQQFFWRLTNYKKQDDFKKQLAAVSLLKKDNKIKDDAIQRNILLRNILTAGVVFFILLAFIVYRVIDLRRENERLEKTKLQYALDKELAENEQKQSALQKKAAELEMQALRSQMNPHFIFNCLSSINSFILKNKTEDASRYLTKFSRLIRMVLNNSQQSYISLDDELETLQLYLDMEKLRFKNSFEYVLNLSGNIEVQAIFIPPLLIQPFAENAIWHGLMHKQEKGLLMLDFSIEDRLLNCVITDNGIGREGAALVKSKSSEKQKSMGLKITTERLNLLNNDGGCEASFTIKDLKDESGNASGTRVRLRIGYKTLNQIL